MAGVSIKIEGRIPIVTGAYPAPLERKAKDAVAPAACPVISPTKSEPPPAPPEQPIKDQFGLSDVNRLDAWSEIDVSAAGGDACERWNMLAVLAWIASRNRDTALRANLCRFDCTWSQLGRRTGVKRWRGPRDNEGRCRPELAALMQAVHLYHCSCAKKPAEWHDCRCIDRAFDEFRAWVQRGEVHVYGEANQERRRLTDADFVRMVRPDDSLAWIQLANGLQLSTIEVQSRDVVNNFLSDLSESLLAAWIAKSSFTDQNKAWREFQSQFGNKAYGWQERFRVAWADIKNPARKRGPRSRL